MRSSWLLVAVLLGTLPCGCVTRRYLITSDPPGAIVYRDGQPIGPTPVEEPFVYYGKYRFRLVKDGYAPLDVEPKLYAPWYQWAGIDFIAENVIPYPFRDVQCLHFQLQPVEMVRPDDVRMRGEQLRERGKSIQTPPGTVPPPKIKAPALPPPIPAPAGNPLPTPMPTPSLPGPTPAAPEPESPFPAPTPAEGEPGMNRPGSTITNHPSSSKEDSKEAFQPGVRGFPVSRPGAPTRRSP